MLINKHQNLLTRSSFTKASGVPLVPSYSRGYFSRGFRVLFFSLFLSLFVIGCAKNKVTLKPLPDFSKEVRIAVDWRTNLGRGARLQLRQQTPLEGTDNVIMCDWRRVVSLNIENGRRMWRKKLGAPITGCSGGFGDRIYVGDEDGIVYSLDSESGDIIWQSDLGIGGTSAPTANENIVLVQTVNEKLFALDANDGSQIWSYSAFTPPLTLFGSFRPLLLGNVVLSGFADGSVVVLDQRNGNVISFSQLVLPQGTSDLENLVDIDGGAVINENVMYVSSYGGATIALNLQSGREVWRRPLGSSLPMVIHNNALYLLDNDSRLYALNLADGETLWENEDYLYRGLTGPALSGDYLILGDDKGYVHAVNTQSGEPAARRRMSITGFNNFALATTQGVLMVEREGFAAMVTVR